jgi:dTDP-4-amino-4,6-dideoxy-D-galactose acyltransferase
MTASILQHRAWDTQHFGYPVASINRSDLGAEEVHRVLQFAQQQGYQLVYWASRREYAEDSDWMREHQGMLVDRKTTYFKKLAPLETEQESGNFSFVEWDPNEDSPELIELGVAAGLWSRFGVDPRISEEKFRSLYEIWMRRSLARELSDMVLVVFENGSSVPMGMVTITINQGVGHIGLIAVSEHQRGRGLGRMLVEAANRWMVKHGATSAQVVTQLHNRAACRLYEQAGYQVEAIEYFYHFWLTVEVCALRAS